MKARSVRSRKRKSDYGKIEHEFLDWRKTKYGELKNEMNELTRRSRKDELSDLRKCLRGESIEEEFSDGSLSDIASMHA